MSDQCFRTDTVDSLSREQLELMAKSDGSLVVYYLRENTVLDAERIRLLLELGSIEAARRLAEMPSNVK